jgi:methionyl-tRNA synthetase
MTKKYFDGIVPAPGEETELDRELKAEVALRKEKAVKLMSEYHVADSLDEIFVMLRRANKYIDETPPWTLAKNESDRPRLATVIYNLLEVIRVAAVLLVPYITATSEKIFAQLGTALTDYSTVAEFGALESGKPLGEAEVLFQRIDEKKFLEEQEAKRLAAIAAAQPVPEPEHEAEITIDSFGAVELRVAEILECEPVPKAKKLLKLQVDLGYEQRQIVSGIAKFYEPEAIIGKKVIVVANLKPATLCGIESQGMLLAASSEAADSPIRVVFLSDDTPMGDRVR